MASTSVSTSHPDQTDHLNQLYKVFLSFRGEDTRYYFTDHLYKALIQEGIRTFRDNEEIEKGQELKSEIETPIIESKAFIVVLSENYAKSRWCLNELCLILEQKKLGHFVLPVFFHVDPSDIRNHRGSFAIEKSKWTKLAKVADLTCVLNCLECLGIEAKEGLKWTVDDVRRWKVALTEVGSMSGTVVSGTRFETNIIEEVVDLVRHKIDSKQLSIPAHLSGMETRVQVINSLLHNDQYNAIAICGMGGSGKTTLAKYIYNLNKQDFESCSFVEEIGKQYKDREVELQKQLLKDVFWGREAGIPNASEGTSKIEEVLVTKKVLLVLDDIDDQDELNTLLGKKTFSTQSKIIVTTRCLDTCAWFRSLSWRCMEYKLKNLSYHESLQLLSWHAFESRCPKEGFEGLAGQLAQYCGGNPLALRVLGSSLFVSDEDQNNRNGMIEIWRERMDSLNSLEGDLDLKIQVVLRKSFDSLQRVKHKELFLDIASFFVGENKNMVMILRDDLDAKSGIKTLINKCLLTVSPDTDELMMHQLLQDMGRKIVCEESNQPIERSRVWNDNESYRVLKKGDVSKKMQGLALDIRKVEQGMGSEASDLETSSLAKIENLKLLQLKYVKLTGSYENFPELRWLCWHGCPLETMPFGLLMSSLVVVDMSYSQIETFEAPTVLPSLKILNLQECDKLVSICNLLLLCKLETLILCYCSSLTHLCKSIGDLKSLTLLNLKGCIELLKASEQPLFSLPCSLKHLYLNNCNIKRENDVQVAFHDASHFELSLECNRFEFLPNSIDLKLLKTLNLYACSFLKSLPCIPSTLEELNIDGCFLLKKVTFQSDCFSLQQFSYRACFNLSEIQGLFKLVPISEIDEADLVQDMQWIKEYEDRQMFLVGDKITNGRRSHIQMLYEYGIMSTYLQGINDQIMMTSEYTSSFGFLSFRVPFHHKKNRIKGLIVSCLYRSSAYNGTDSSCLLAKISNTTKGLTWVYNPVIYCKPCVNEDALWLSYWPIGNILDVDDVVRVDVIVDEGAMIVTRCGASLVYMDGEVEKEENWENSTMKGEEVIRGDLSEFEVTPGGYYLCRRDLFGSETSSRLNQLFGENVHYPVSQGWKKIRQSRMTTIQDIRRWKEALREVATLKGMSLSSSRSEAGLLKKMVDNLQSMKETFRG